MKLKELLTEVNRVTGLVHLDRMARLEATVARYEGVLLPELARRLEVAADALRRHTCVDFIKEEPNMCALCKALLEVEGSEKQCNDEYEKAYKGVPKATVRVIGNCPKCSSKVATEDCLAEGVYWDPPISCGKCGTRQSVTLCITKVQSSWE